jgi:hypothetical protein
MSYISQPWCSTSAVPRLLPHSITSSKATGPEGRQTPNPPITPITLLREPRTA